MRTSSITIALVGSTGAIGHQVLQLLNNESRVDRIITFTRKPNLNKLSKEENHVIDFNQLAALDGQIKADVFICCLGTTIKAAGSQAGFKKVDLDYVVEFGKLAETVSAQKFLVVSSLGADANSTIFYSRIKGEMENELKKLKLPSLEIFQPSLLIGARTESRPGESFAQFLTPIINPFLQGLLKKYRPIKITDVARAICLRALSTDQKKITYSSDQIKDLIS
jgi:uncharacterized protein YbjT (DUF2867 family)